MNSKEPHIIRSAFTSSPIDAVKIGDGFVGMESYLTMVDLGVGVWSLVPRLISRIVPLSIYCGTVTSSLETE